MTRLGFQTEQDCSDASTLRRLCTTRIVKSGVQPLRIFKTRETARQCQSLPRTSPVTHGETPTDFLRGRWSGWCLAAVSAEWMRRNSQKVYLDPDNQDAEDNHPSHAAVEGPKDAKIRPKLAEKYEWVVPPPNRYDPPD